MAGLSDWARKLLEGRRHAVLGTVNEDGSPHLTPIWYLFRDERLFVAAPSFTRKVRNVIARPTATLIVDVRSPGTERWVAGTGPVAILRGDESRSVNAAIHERYLTEEARRDPRVGGAFAAVDDVTIRIAPTVWRSWASADVDAQFFGGVLSASPERWFRELD